MSKPPTVPLIINIDMSLPPQVSNYLSAIDKKFQNQTVLTHFETNTGLPRSYAVVGFGAVYLALVFLNVGGIGQLLTNIAGFAVPGYYSIVALKSATKDDDTQLLTYWVVFAFLNVVEFWSKAILFWVPFYFLFKLVFLLYIGIPATGGATIVYQHLVGPISDVILGKVASKVE